MPQMSPIKWLLLFFFFFFTYMIFNIFNYYNLNIKPIMSNSMNYNSTLNKNWKW